MRKLEPITDGALDVYDVIIDVKDERARLARLRNRIAAAYHRYEEKGHKLHRMRPLSGIHENDRRALLHCYTGRTTPRDRVYAKIRKLAYWCPYCTIVQVQTLDHYLSKDEFPEFAVLTKNLVPSCHTCNRPGKRHRDAGSGRRVLVHPYFDDVETTGLWVAKLRFERGTPEAEFVVIRGTDFGELSARHAENLDLEERFSAWAMEGGELNAIVLTVKSFPPGNWPGARANLLEQARVEARRGEPNLARIALLEAAAASDELMELCLGAAS